MCKILCFKRQVHEWTAYRLSYHSFGSTGLEVHSLNQGRERTHSKPHDKQVMNGSNRTQYRTALHTLVQLKLHAQEPVQLNKMIAELQRLSADAF